MESKNHVDNEDLGRFLPAEQLENTPSRARGMSAHDERKHRRLAAQLTQNLGDRLKVSQQCINTALVYMHRFYALHPIAVFHRNKLVPAALCLAGKAEEEASPLWRIVAEFHACLNVDPREVNIAELCRNVTLHESILLATLGFSFGVEHAQEHITMICVRLKASHALTEVAYFVEANSLHLTTMCLRYKPVIVACFCVYIASKLLNVEVLQPDQKRFWFQNVDPTITLDLLNQLSVQFLDADDMQAESYPSSNGYNHDASQFISRLRRMKFAAVSRLPQPLQHKLVAEGSLNVFTHAGSRQAFATLMKPSEAPWTSGSVSLSNRSQHGDYFGRKSEESVKQVRNSGTENALSGHANSMYGMRRKDVLPQTSSVNSDFKESLPETRYRWLSSANGTFRLHLLSAPISNPEIETKMRNATQSQHTVSSQKPLSAWSLNLSPDHLQGTNTAGTDARIVNREREPIYKVGTYTSSIKEQPPREQLYQQPHQISGFKKIRLISSPKREPLEASDISNTKINPIHSSGDVLRFGESFKLTNTKQISRGERIVLRQSRICNGGGNQPSSKHPFPSVFEERNNCKPMQQIKRKYELDENLDLPKKSPTRPGWNVAPNAMHPG
ncbi:uncharacterized protein LOC129761840 [Toxorhynchites rutilus septentrionalis]|uniref:uncharacterized protein LOC129761840 n=1 Tax=Toxorhynchites rutilus septentrionalis TaxID=329112 RepID=UPI002478440D|nr:uncharacterized protein LOC129761840 [Toxorhynchites rutilus septentrionalis]